MVRTYGLEVEVITPGKARPRYPLLNGEPIVPDGERIGLLTSGAYEHTLGAAIGMGYVRHEGGVMAELLRTARFEIAIAGERYPADASLAPFFDPKGAGLRA